MTDDNDNNDDLSDALKNALDSVENMDDDSNDPYSRIIDALSLIKFSVGEIKEAMESKLTSFDA
jgi:hypothetical protein